MRTLAPPPPDGVGDICISADRREPPRRLAALRDTTVYDFVAINGSCRSCLRRRSRRSRGQIELTRNHGQQEPLLNAAGATCNYDVAAGRFFFRGDAEPEGAARARDRARHRAPVTEAAADIRLYGRKGLAFDAITGHLRRDRNAGAARARTAAGPSPCTGSCRRTSCDSKARSHGASAVFTRSSHCTTVRS